MQVTQENSKKQNNSQTFSVCDIMKNNTSKIIKKLESQIPPTFQLYSDLYSEYLHSFDDFFGTCYLAEKELLDKLGSDKKALQNFQEISDTITKNFEKQIEITNNMQRTFIKMRTDWIKIYEQQIHIMMDFYSKFLSNINTNLNKK